MVYVAEEGVVLGADSTSSVPCADGLHYFDFNQKVFEIGQNSTLGIVTWGLGSLRPTSYRTLVALLDDDLAATPAMNVREVAQRWCDSFWKSYAEFEPVVRCRHLHSMLPCPDGDVVPLPNSRTKEEENDYWNLRYACGVGFCVAGYMLPDRSPQAIAMYFDPLQPKPGPEPLMGPYSGWGVPNVIDRLIFGSDANLRRAILSSSNWTGTESELDQLLREQTFQHGPLPIRDAVDFVYSGIYSTIKGMKFSSMPQVCGGPIEIAVITTDRKLRWVRHKAWDAAINDGVVL
jgi:hypothetical protein